MLNNKSDKRAFKRIPMEFVLEVSAKDIAGNRYKDRTVLKNISGEGAMFITQLAGKYFSGQQLDMTICLPGTDDVKACMSGKATVMRIDLSGDSGTDLQSRDIHVAVRFDAPLSFKRIDVERRGNCKKAPGGLGRL